MDGTDQPDEVRQQSSGCVWPSPSPVKQGTDITQYSRPCEPPLDHQPRHVTHTLSAFTTSQGGRIDMQADRHKKSLHLILSLYTDRQSQRTQRGFLIPSLLKSGSRSSFCASLVCFGWEGNGKSKSLLTIRFLASTMDPTSQYIYDYYLSINASVSSVGVHCPASGLTRQ